MPPHGTLVCRGTPVGNHCIRKITTELKPKTCFGYDNIPVRILLDGMVYLLGPQHKLLNIYNKNVIPDQWKTSLIIPIHKKGP
jgi:hypothetical protein